MERIPRHVLEKSTLRIIPQAFLSNGGRVELEPIEIAPLERELNLFRDNEIYQHEGNGPEDENSFYLRDKYSLKDGESEGFSSKKDFFLRNFLAHKT